MHSRFKEQLLQATRSDGSVDLDKLGELVGRSYDESDRDRESDRQEREGRRQERREALSSS